MGIRTKIRIKIEIEIKIKIMKRRISSLTLTLNPNLLYIHRPQSTPSSRNCSRALSILSCNRCFNGGTAGRMRS